MIYFGKYQIHEWNKPKISAWSRTFYRGDLYMGHIQICTNLGDQDTYQPRFNFLEEIKTLYFNMYGPTAKEFYSVDEAKAHVDSFIEKLQKLKAFL